jgi:hypothetical protein
MFLEHLPQVNWGINWLLSKGGGVVLLYFSVLLINFTYVISYDLYCTAHLMNNLYAVRHVRMTVLRTVTVSKYNLWLGFVLRHRHTLHKVLAERTLDGD